MAHVGIGDPWEDDLTGEELEDPSATRDDSPSAHNEPEAATATTQTPLACEPESLVFWLFAPNRKLSVERESMLALLIANNRRLHLKDGARILGLEQATLRMRFTRASKEGWTKHSGISYWSLSRSGHYRPGNADHGGSRRGRAHGVADSRAGSDRLCPRSGRSGSTIAPADPLPARSCALPPTRRLLGPLNCGRPTGPSPTPPTGSTTMIDRRVDRRDNALGGRGSRRPGKSVSTPC